MIVKFNSAAFMKEMENVVKYSVGYLEGVHIGKQEFLRKIGATTIELLKEYIDSNARVNPAMLHHVYEWGKAGNASSRLFEFSTRVSGRTISVVGNFLPSKSISETSHEAFVNKAKVMEDSIQVVIEPKNSDVLVFENKGDVVFTKNAIYIDHPGGDEVAGSFGETVDNFFENYFTNGLLRPLIEKLSRANEFTQSLSATSGRNVGVRAGKEYLNIKGMVE